MYDFNFLFSRALDISGATTSASVKSGRIDLRAVAENHLGTTAVTNLGDVFVKVVAVVTTALSADTGTATLTAALYEHTADSDITAGNLIKSNDTSVAVTTAIIPVGTKILDEVINLNDIDERYIGCDFSPATQNMDEGAVDVYLQFLTAEQL